MFPAAFHYFRNICLLIFILSSLSLAQDSTQSLAFKNKNIFERRNFFYQPDPSYQLWQQFHLIQAANSGDPFAEHELGIRYLLGEGIAADTVKGAYWIRKAADKELTAAQFNYGILLLNGWGVDWNPFEAFKYFRFAAIGGMPAAEHILGIFYTDDLVVKANWAEAYYWIKKSSDAGFEPAKEIIPEILKKYTPQDSTEYIPSTLSETDLADKKIDNDISSNLGLVFINFETTNDTTVNVTNEMLLEDLTSSLPDALRDSLNFSDSTLNFDRDQIAYLLKSSEFGNPEAMVILGRLYESGIHYPKNLIAAAAYYIRAARLDSPKGLYLLWQLSTNKNLLKLVQLRSDKQDAEAMYVWYALSSLGFDQSIAIQDAINLLTKSADRNYFPALVELGLITYTGKYSDESKQEGNTIWHKAKSLGNKEAEVRLIAAVVFDDISISADNLLNDLNTLNDEGSILAQVTLAYCYQTGKFVKQNIAEAVKLYRYAAHRGNRFAYDQLKNIYKNLRPSENIFQIN